MFILQIAHKNIKILTCKNLIQIFHQFSIYSTKMDLLRRQHLIPPIEVRGMTILDKIAFTKVVSVPSITVNLDEIQKVSEAIKKYFLKLKQFSSIVTLSDSPTMRQFLLDPDITEENSIRDIFKELNINLNFKTTDIEVLYENWPAQQIFDSVLPEDVEKTSSFSQIGHIIHLNLREHLLPYRFLIGQVYLDKNKQTTLVVNKDNIIDDSDNTFRTFKMEKLAGNNESTEVTVSESCCKFNFDFAKVYWNPRLGTEHGRIVKKLNKYDILYDVMAGVGPFAVPAAKKKCTVLANDLNPHSYESLKKNCLQNKVGDTIQCFNLDGNHFIRNELKDHLLSILSDPYNYRSIHITMNLPSIAIDFLPSFKNLFDEKFPKLCKDDYQDVMPYLPQMHVYLFSYIELKEYAMYLVAEKLGLLKKTVEISEDRSQINASLFSESFDSLFLQHLIETIQVRKVSTSKIMYRVSLYLPKEILIKEYDIENPTKKIKLS